MTGNGKGPKKASMKNKKKVKDVESQFGYSTPDQRQPRKSIADILSLALKSRNVW